MPLEQTDLVQAAQELEPLPPTAARLANLLSRADWDIHDVEEAIAFDQALTAKLLRLANSALWFRGHAIASVRDAVMRLGSGTVFGLVMGAGVQKRLSRALPQYGLREGELWTHSVAATLAASVLDRKSRADVPIEAPASALLHDVGKLVMARFLDPDRQHRIEEVRRTEGLTQHEAEVAVMGLDHAELGGVIGIQWQLPERLVTGIVHHHTPEATEDAIGSVVHVADVLAHRAQTICVGSMRGEAPLPPSREAVELLALSELELEEAARAVASELADVLRRYA
jgi:HD-like signal output (HDOD) protein